MRASAARGKRRSIMTDYTLRLLGLEACADTPIGSQLVRGISGGQRKRVTTGAAALPAPSALGDPANARQARARPVACFLG